MQTKTKGNIRLIIRIALVIVIAVVGIVIFWNRSVSADALATNTNKQVKISYYSGVPEGQKAYEEACKEEKEDVHKIEYTTKSLGRMQWGKELENGTHSVYYDAADVHTLADYFDDAQESYMDLYECYIKAYKAVME